MTTTRRPPRGVGAGLSVLLATILVATGPRFARAETAPVPEVGGSDAGIAGPIDENPPARGGNATTAPNPAKGGNGTSKAPTVPPPDGAASEPRPPGGGPPETVPGLEAPPDNAPESPTSSSGPGPGPTGPAPAGPGPNGPDVPVADPDGGPPRAPGAPDATAPTPASAPAVDASGRVDLNRADIATLTSLPGFTPELAAAIVRARDAQGGFRTVFDVMKVEGMKGEIFEQIHDRLAIRKDRDPAAATASAVGGTPKTPSPAGTPAPKPRRIGSEDVPDAASAAAPEPSPPAAPRPGRADPDEATGGGATASTPEPASTATTPTTGASTSTPAEAPPRRKDARKAGAASETAKAPGSTPLDTNPEPFSGRRSVTPDVVFKAALGLARRGKTDQARDGFQDFIKNYPSDARVADAEFLVAAMFEEDERFSEAIERYRRVYEDKMNPFRGVALFRVGVCHDREKNLEEAVAAYNRFRAEFPNSRFADEVDGRLQALGSR